MADIPAAPGHEAGKDGWADVPWRLLAPFAPDFAGSADVEEQLELHMTRIRRTIELANEAASEGNHPFAALLTERDSGKIVLEAKNTVAVDKDPTKHAELNLCSLASQKFSRKEMADLILYTSTEPCAMCSGAMFWLGIRLVVFGCTEKRLGEIYQAQSTLSDVDSEGVLSIPCREIFGKATAKVFVLGPVVQLEAEKPHLDYWK